MRHEQQLEIAKYEHCYRDPNYRMGRGRYEAAERVLAGLAPGSVLDIGAGRGELREVAARHGHTYAGIEPVPYLASEYVTTGVATALPVADKSIDYVCCLDVIEHVLPEDVRPALLEMRRVAKAAVFITASTRSHRWMRQGPELHPSHRPLADWQALFDEVFGRAHAIGMCGVSPGWLIEVTPCQS